MNFGLSIQACLLVVDKAAEKIEYMTGAVLARQHW